MISAEEFLSQLPQQNPPDPPLPESGSDSDSAKSISEELQTGSDTAAGQNSDKYAAGTNASSVTSEEWNSTDSGASRMKSPESNLLRPAEENRCQEAALRLLDAAPRSSGALRQRLIDKGFEEHTVDRVIDRLTDSQLIDDETYAKAMVHYCLSRQLGEFGTRRELLKKKVGQGLIDTCLEQARQDGLFDQALQELAVKIAKKTRGLDRKVRLRRFWSAGARKGHNPEAIKRYSSYVSGTDNMTDDLASLIADDSHNSRFSRFSQFDGD